MKHLLQRPLPDELLSSVWVRTVRRAGLPIRSVARALTGGRKWAPGFFQLSHITDLAPILRMDPLQLLWGHTVFPYATAFFEPSVYAGALGSALSTGVAAIGMGAVTQSASDPVRLKRYCSTCAREDLRRWGESYWQRAHNLPGVLLCHKHGAVLRETQARTTGFERWDERLPHEVTGDRMVHQPLNAFDRELAKRSIALLNRQMETQVVRDQSWYREALVSRGLLTPDRQVNAQKLALWAHAQMNGSGLRYGLNERDQALGWLAVMVRPRSGHPFIPLKHLLFETALAQQGNVIEPLLDHVPPGPPGRPKVELDREYAAAVRRVVEGYVQRGERVRIQDALTEAGCWSAFRHGRTTLPRTAKEVGRLLVSAAAMRHHAKLVR